MKREEIINNICSLPYNNICLQLSTGVGKTRCAIEFMRTHNIKNALIVIPRLVLIGNWEAEFRKWDFECNVTFTTYISLYKQVDKEWEIICYDEAHHLTENSLEAVEHMKSKYNLLLSATVPRNKKELIFPYFKDLYTYKVSLRDAIDNEILPDPKVLLVPLHLDTIERNKTITIGSGKTVIECRFEDRWKYIRDKSLKLVCKCSQMQYIKELDRRIDYYKKLYLSSRGDRLKNLWLHTAGERLKALAEFKESYVKSILSKLKNYRTITFCSSIEQCERLGSYPVTSKGNNASINLELFNNGKIKHITAVNMLNEGINLSDCKIGIFVVLNSSDIMQKQKVGRTLRHKKPVIIILYFKDTREEDIVADMLESYNDELITTVDNINNILTLIKE